MGWRRLPGGRRCNPLCLTRHQAMPVDQICSTQCKKRLPSGEMDALGVAPARQIAQRRAGEQTQQRATLQRIPSFPRASIDVFKRCCAQGKDPPREPPRRRLPRACKRRNQGAASRPHFRAGAQRLRGDAAVLGSRASGRQPPAGPLPAPWRLTARGGAAAVRPGTPASLGGAAVRRRGWAAAALPSPALRGPHDLQQRQPR